MAEQALDLTKEAGRLVSHPGEQKLRKAFTHITNWSSNGLVNRLLEEDIDMASRNAAYILIGQGADAGLLVRAGNPGGYSYTLNSAWSRPGWSKPAGTGVQRPRLPGRTPVAPMAKDFGKPSDSYAGPAFGSGLLIPNMGRVCEPTLEELDCEITPHMGGRLVDSLHRQFNAMFPGIE